MLILSPFHLPGAYSKFYDAIPRALSHGFTVKRSVLIFKSLFYPTTNTTLFVTKLTK
jgi:hypothetical protein